MASIPTSKQTPVGTRLGSPGTAKPRPSSSRPSAQGVNRSATNTSKPAPIGASTPSSTKGINLPRPFDDQNGIFDPAVTNDGGECIPLLDVFVTQDFLFELDALVEPHIHPSPWSVSAALIPSRNSPTSQAAASYALGVLADAELELALMTKWSERCRLRSSLPRPASLLSEGDLRDRHLVLFFHSIYLWCRENSLTRPETSVILAIGKLIFDRILATIPRSVEPNDVPSPPVTITNDKTNTITPNKASTGTGGSKSSTGSTMKKVAADKLPIIPSSTLAANLPVIPVPHLLPVLSTYLHRLLSFHNVTTPYGGNETQKWQVLSPKVSESAALFFQFNLLSHIRLIRQAYGSSGKRSIPSRPTSSNQKQILVNDDSNRIPTVTSDMQSTLSYPLCKSIINMKSGAAKSQSKIRRGDGVMAASNIYPDPDGDMSFSDSDLDCDDHGHHPEIILGIQHSSGLIPRKLNMSFSSAKKESLPANKVVSGLIHDMDLALSAVQSKLTSGI